MLTEYWHTSMQREHMSCSHILPMSHYTVIRPRLSASNQCHYLQWQTVKWYALFSEPTPSTLPKCIFWPYLVLLQPWALMFWPQNIITSSLMPVAPSSKIQVARYCVAYTNSQYKHMHAEAEYRVVVCNVYALCHRSTVKIRFSHC